MMKKYSTGIVRTNNMYKKYIIKITVHFSRLKKLMYISEPQNNGINGMNHSPYVRVSIYDHNYPH